MALLLRVAHDANAEGEPAVERLREVAGISSLAQLAFEGPQSIRAAGKADVTRKMIAADDREEFRRAGGRLFFTGITRSLSASCLALSSIRVRSPPPDRCFTCAIMSAVGSGDIAWAVR